MAGAITINLTADPSGIEAATKRAKAAFEDFQKSSETGADDLSEKLEDVITGTVNLGKAMGRSSDDIVSDLRTMGFSAEDAEDAVKAVERAAEDVGDTSTDIKKAGDAVDDLGDKADNASEQTGKISDKASEVGDGLRSLGDIAKSALEGDLGGAASSATDLIGGLLGAGALGGIAGAAASAAGELGLGLVTSAWDKIKEKEEQAAQAASDWAQKYIESANGVINSASIVAEMQSIATDPDRYKEAQENAENWGIQVSDAMRAMAGDSTALAIVQQSLTDQTNAAAEAWTEEGISLEDKRKLVLTHNEALREGTTAYNDLASEMANGKEQSEAYASALFNYATQVGVTTGETDNLGNAIVRLPDGKEIVIDAQNQQAFENIDAVEQRQIQDKTVTIQVDSSAYDNWSPPMKTAYVQTRVQNPDWAAPILGTYVGG